MGRGLSPQAERITTLAVGKSCVIATNPENLLRRIRKVMPGAKFSRHAVDGQYVITRTA